MKKLVRIQQRLDEALADIEDLRREMGGAVGYLDSNASGSRKWAKDLHEAIGVARQAAQKTRKAMEVEKP